MKEKSKSFIFTVDVYNARVHILYLLSDEEIKTYVDENFPGAVYNRNGTKAAFSGAIDADGYCEYFVDFIYSPKNKIYLHDTIAHEAHHITQYIFDDRGVKSDRENSEPEAYLLGYIVRKITEGIFSK